MGSNEMWKSVLLLRKVYCTGIFGKSPTFSQKISVGGAEETQDMISKEVLYTLVLPEWRNYELYNEDPNLEYEAALSPDSVPQ